MASRVVFRCLRGNPARAFEAGRSSCLIARNGQLKRQNQRLSRTAQTRCQRQIPKHLRRRLGIPLKGDSSSVNTTLTLSTLALAILVTTAPADAQNLEIQGLEVTPLIGGRFGGTFDVQPEGAVETRASLGDSVSYGVAAGIRFDDFSLIEFRWTRANSGLRFETGLNVNPLSTPPIVDVTLNQFHGDFTREFALDEVTDIRPYVMASVGATHLGSSSNGFTRFSFGIGTGLKITVNSRLGVRLQAQWLPIWVQPEVSSFACGFGGCIAVLSGRLTQQFEVSAGPVFRF